MKTTVRVVQTYKYGDDRDPRIVVESAERTHAQVRNTTTGRITRIQLDGFHAGDP